MIKSQNFFGMNIYKANRAHFAFNFRSRKIEKNHYELLGVPYDSDIDTIKKAYFKLAKKFHPDINPNKDAEERFKEVQKAYEILGDPNNRIAYDIDKNYSNEAEKYVKRNAGGSETRFNTGPRTIKNFYFNRWTDFKIPKWSNLKSGVDMRSEYLYRKDDAEFDKSHQYNEIIRLLIKYRVFLYFLFVISFDIFIFADNIGNIMAYQMSKEMFLKVNKL